MFPHYDIPNELINWMKWAAMWENRIFAYAKTKLQISFPITATLIVLNLKFQTSSSFLWLYSLGFFNLVGNPEDRFPRFVAQIMWLILICIIYLSLLKFKMPKKSTSIHKICGYISFQTKYQGYSSNHTLRKSEPHHKKTSFLHMQKQRCRSCNYTTDQGLCFRCIDSTIPLPKNRNFKPLAIFCGCTAWFVSDQVKNSF